MWADDRATRLLTPEEIHELNRQGGRGGASFDQNGSYFLAFLMNDKPNKAVEPRPFQVPTEYLDTIAETAIGMPFVVGPDPFHHVYAASGKPEDIVRLSQKYAWGEIASTLKNPKTNNVYAVVKAFKEYVPRIQRGELPKYTSPMIAPDDLAEALGTGVINGGRILHLQAVAAPGYDPKVAQVKGHVCGGMLGECMNELRALAAAGNLKSWQDKILVYTPDYDAVFEGRVEDMGDLPDVLAGSGHEQKDADDSDYEEVFESAR